MKFAAIIVLLISVVAARQHHRTLLETIIKSKSNLFMKVGDDVQSVINNLFDSLNLKNNFVTKSRIKSFLTMHYDLKSMAEKNFDEYERMIDAAKPDTCNKTTNEIGLLGLIGEILDENYTNITRIINEKKNLRQHIKHRTVFNTTQADWEFTDSKEFMQFIRDFIIKVDSLSEKDFTKHPTTLTNDEEYGDVTEPNLEEWRPPPVLELDYVNDTNSRRIFKGKKTRIKSYPFMVSVHLMGTFTCAGCLISKDLVITAASCLQLLHNTRFYRENPRSVFVRVGSDYFSRLGETIDIIETYFHPTYDPKTLKNNLVILRLQRHIQFSKKRKKIKRILYDRTEAHLPFNVDGIIIVGWGPKTNTHIVYPLARMLVAQLDIFHVEECAEIYSKTYVTNKHFCAGFIASGGGACNRDLGAPGIVGGKLVGVVSFGSPVCGSINSPTVFTKLGFYAEWIDSIVEMQPPSQRAPSTVHRFVTRVPLQTAQTTVNLITPVTTEESIGRQRASYPEDILVLENVLLQLSESNDSLLQDILYEYPEEDINDIFQRSEKVDPLQHPLENKTLYLIPDTNTFDTKTEYVTIPMNTSSTALPNSLTGHVGTTPSTTTTTRTPMPTREDNITDLIQRTPTMGQLSFKPVEMGSPNPQIEYSSNEDTTKDNTTNSLTEYYSDDNTHGTSRDNDDDSDDT